ncbi:hypothetical protein KSP39_PZI010652 [Platanthera zijinensis]|uniref:Uncharacterized protein n=1 Tax=Platanthera zijinensis TaxID=2320716 RepID=A0AAP0G6Z3_9ASPA
MGKMLYLRSYDKSQQSASMFVPPSVDCSYPWDGNREVFNFIHLWIFLLCRFHRLQSSPHITIALESKTKHDLPNPVLIPDPAFRLGVGQLIPLGAVGSVAKSVEGHPGRLHVPLGQLQVLLKLLQHGPYVSMNAEMLECKLEIRNVGLNLHL